MRRVLTLLLVAGTLVSLATASRATLIGSLTNKTGDTNAYYQYTNNGGPPSIGGNGTFATTVPTPHLEYVFNVPVAGLPGTVNVRLESFNSVDNGPALDIPSTFVSQPQQNVTWRIVLDGAQGSFADGTLVLGINPVFPAGVPPPIPPTGHLSQAGTAQPAFGGSTLVVGGQDLFTFSSAVYQPLLVPESYTWTFSVPPGVDLTNNVSLINGVMDNVTLGGVATFAAEFEVPEPGVLGMLLCSGVAGSLFVLRRRRAA